jgi:alcohol dehydrogenase class IV
MRFELSVPTEIVFGPGVVSTLGEHAAGFGRRAFLVTGRSLERLDPGFEAVRWVVHGEPDTESVDSATARAREVGCDLVIGVGGGSVLDTAKAVACLAANGGECLDYLEVVGRGKPIARESLPFIAVPSTGGTGSETTRNAVVAHRPSRTKASLRSPHMMARLALVDPELSLTVPPAVTAATGLDALTQLIEPYTSRRAHPLIDALALDAIRRAALALSRAFDEPSDLAARSEMMYAGMVSGIALAHAGLGAAHGFSGPLGGSFPVPHGFACAAVLPHVMEANLRKGSPDTVRRYHDIAQALGATTVAALCAKLQVPGLATYGMTRADVPDIAARARLTSSMRANPVDLSDSDLGEILVKAL